MTRIGVIGAGNHSRLHGRSLELIASRRKGTDGEIELCCVCDLDAEKAREYAETFGFLKTYTDIRTMIDSERPDGLLAVTPVDFNEEAVRMLLPEGIPLLIEKPPGTSTKATHDLLQLAERTRTPHMVSFNRRYSPALEWLREWSVDRLDRGRCHLEARMVRNARLESSFVVGTGIHLIDAVLSMLGTPRTVSTVVHPTRASGCSHYTARLVFASGNTADLLIAPNAGYVEERYEIISDGAMATADVRDGTFVCMENGEVAERRVKEEHTDHVIVEGTHGETDAFVSLCEGYRDPAAADLSQALTAMTVAEAIASGGTVELDPQTTGN